MLRKPGLAHVRQAAFQPEVKQTAPGLGPSTNGAGFPFTGATRACVLWLALGIPQPGPLASSASGLARRDPKPVQNPHISFDPHATRAFPADQASRASSTISSAEPEKSASGASVDLNAARMLFQLQNDHSLVSKVGFTAGDATLDRVYTKTVPASSAVLQGPETGQ